MPHTWGPKAGRQFSPPKPAPAPRSRLRVLFVCIGNSCRSQMAEGFALRYGKDVMEAESAGIAPAAMVAPLTRKAMLETKDIDLTNHWPKSVFDVSGAFDLIINMSGYPLPPNMQAGEVREWKVTDPVSGDESVHAQVAEHVERLVQQLILELRARRQ
jgi:arsenate reductase